MKYQANTQKIHSADTERSEQAARPNGTTVDERVIESHSYSRRLPALD